MRQPGVLARAGRSVEGKGKLPSSASSFPLLPYVDHSACLENIATLMRNPLASHWVVTRSVNLLSPVGQITKNCAI